MEILNYLNYSFVSILGDTPYIVVGKQNRFYRLLDILTEGQFRYTQKFCGLQVSSEFTIPDQYRHNRKLKTGARDI